MRSDTTVNESSAEKKGWKKGAPLCESHSVRFVPFVVLIMCQSRITEVLNSAIMPAQKKRRIQEADHFGISKHDTIRGEKKSLIPSGIRGSD